MFAFSQIEPERTGYVTQMPVPLSKYMSASWDQGLHDSMFNSISRMEEMRLERNEDSPILQPDELNKRYSLPTLKFEEPTKESVARLIHSRKIAELERQYWLDNGYQGFFTMRNGMGMGTAMISSILNPLDFATMLLPVVGQEKMAANVVGSGFRASVNRATLRGLIAEEAIKTPAPRLVGTVINGAVGGAALTFPHYLSAKQDKENFTEHEYLMGVGMMGVLSGGIHLGVSGFRRSVRVAARTIDRIKPETREAMVKQALENALRDEPIRVHDYVRIDENAIRESVMFDEAAARREALAKVSLEDVEKYVWDKYKETVMFPTIRVGTELVHGLRGDVHDLILERLMRENPDRYENIGSLIDEGIEPEMGFMTDKGKFVSRDEAADIQGTAWLTAEALHQEQSLSPGDPIFLSPDERELYDRLLEEHPREVAWNAAMALRKRVAIDNFFSQPKVQEMIQGEYEARLNEFVERMRKEYDPEEAFGLEVRREIDRQIAEGRKLTQDVIDAHSYPQEITDKDTATIQKEVEALKQELGIVDEATERGAAEKLVDAALKKIEAGIKILSEPINKGGKMFTGVTGLEPIIAMVGKEVAKGLLIALREGLKLTKDVAKAVDHAMEWWKIQSRKPDVVTKASNDVRLAQSEIKENLVKAKESGDKEAIEKWSKLLNPDMNRRGFLGLIGKAAAAAGIMPASTVSGIAKFAKSKGFDSPFMNMPMFKFMNDLFEVVGGDSAGGLTDLMQPIFPYVDEHLDLSQWPSVKEAIKTLTPEDFQNLLSKYGDDPVNVKGWMGKALQEGSGDSYERVLSYAAEHKLALKHFPGMISGVAHIVEGKFSGLHDAMGSLTLNQLIEKGLMTQEQAKNLIVEAKPMFKLLMEGIRDPSTETYVLTDEWLTKAVEPFPDMAEALKNAAGPAVRKALREASPEEREYPWYKNYEKIEKNYPLTSEEQLRAHLEQLISDLSKPVLRGLTHEEYVGFRQELMDMGAGSSEIEKTWTSKQRERARDLYSMVRQEENRLGKLDMAESVQKYRGQSDDEIRRSIFNGLIKTELELSRSDADLGFIAITPEQFKQITEEHSMPAILDEILEGRKLSRSEERDIVKKQIKFLRSKAGKEFIDEQLTEIKELLEYNPKIEEIDAAVEKILKQAYESPKPEPSAGG